MRISKLISTTVFFLFFYLSLEVITRKFKIRTEVTRKIAHLLSGIFAIVFSYVLNRPEFLFVTSLFFGFFLLTYLKKSLKSINLIHRKTYGEVAYPLGLIVLAMSLYNVKDAFMIGVLILAVPDTVAGIAGSILRKKGKSLIGSLSYFLCAFIILAFNRDPISSILFACVLTLIEYLSPHGLDNLTIPIGYLLLTTRFLTLKQS